MRSKIASTLRVSATLVSAVMLCLLCTACGGRQSQKEETGVGNLMRYARLLKIYPRQGYEEVQLLDYRDTTKNSARFWIVPDSVKFDTPVPQGVTLLRTPLKSMLIYSSVYAGMLKELGSGESVTGVVDASFFTDPWYTDRIAKGIISDCGTATSPTLEKILALRPQGVMYTLYDGMQSQGLDKVSAAGIPLIPVTDNFEATPLARAEWMRFIGRLAGKGTEADSIFSKVEKSYNAIRGKVAKEGKHPTVLTDNLYEGVWYVPGGRSYQATLIKDAGGKYVWADDTSAGSLNLTYEQVLARAKNADIWIWKAYGYALTRQKLLSLDPRYAHFSAADKGGIYYSDTSISRIYEETPFHPELLLKEYAMIFNGAPTDSLRYYRQMKKYNRS